jgi:hypothetical protein
MSAVISANWESQATDQPIPELDSTPLDTAVEPRLLEPRRIHVSSPLVWAFLILSSLAMVAMGVWGLAHSTLTYGMSSVDSVTTERLAQIQTRLREANAPEAALRQMAIAARPGVNIGDAMEAIVEADQALEPMSGSTVIASAQTELRVIGQNLTNKRYGESGPTMTPLPTLLPIVP